MRVIVLIAHAVLGVVTVWLVTRYNPEIFRSGETRGSRLEISLYLIGAASFVGGYAFNIAFVNEYSTLGGIHNPLWGHGSWAQYIHLMYANPAAGSASIDYTIANVVLLPVVTIVDGRRRGITRPWMFFVCTLFTSFTFGWAFYAATVERQRRLAVESAATA